MYDELYNKLNEATFDTIRRKHRSIKRLFPDFDVKTRGVERMGGLKLVNQDKNRWMFRVHSGTEDNLWYDDVILFKDIANTLKKVVMNRRLWSKSKDKADMRQVTHEFMKRVEVEVKCTCAAFLYWGSAYILSLSKYQAKYTSDNPETRAPKVRNPRQYGAVCFDNRAMVMMGDGTFKSIADVHIGDAVVTHTGRIQRVLQTSQCVSEVIEAKVEGMFSDFSVTPNHKFYVKSRNTKCLCGCGKNLTYSKAIIDTKGINYIHERTMLEFHQGRDVRIPDSSGKLVWVPVKDLDVHSLLYSPRVTYGDEICMDADLARLLGYYAAEGCYVYDYANRYTDNKYDQYRFKNSKGKDVIGQGVTFTLNMDERDTIANDISNIVFEKFGVDCEFSEKTHKHKNGTTSRSLTITVKDTDRKVFSFVRKYIPNVVKVLSPDVLRWNYEARVELLLGLFLGDGTICKCNGQCAITLANMDLIQKCASLLSSIGVKYNLHTYESTNQCKDFQGTRYILHTYMQDLPKVFRSRCSQLEKKNHEHVNYEKVSKSFRRNGSVYEFDGFFRFFHMLDASNTQLRTVYNLEVANDNSYIVNGVSTHNCKHLDRVLKVLPFYATSMTKWLKEFHGEDIARWEKTALAHTTMFKDIGQELGKKQQQAVEPAKDMEVPDDRGVEEAPPEEPTEAPEGDDSAAEDDVDPKVRAAHDAMDTKMRDEDEDKINPKVRSAHDAMDAKMRGKDKKKK